MNLICTYTIGISECYVPLTSKVQIRSLLKLSAGQESVLLHTMLLTVSMSKTSRLAESRIVINSLYLITKAHERTIERRFLSS